MRLYLDATKKNYIYSTDVLFHNTVVMFETYVERNGKIYRKWKIENEKRWHYQLTAFDRLPYEVLKPKHLT